MQRTQQIISLQINLENLVQARPYNAGATMMIAQVITQDGQIVQDKTNLIQQPVIAEDITDEVLAILNASLIDAGLTLIRNVDTAPEATDA